MSRALILALCATLAACGGGNEVGCFDTSAPLPMAASAPAAPTVGAAAVQMPTSQSAPTIGTHLAVADTIKTTQPMQPLPPVGDDGGDIPTCAAIARR
jgi:hypothetical protein